MDLCFRSFIDLEYMRKIQSNEVNQSVQSLSLLMPSLGEQLLEDQDDKYFAQSCK